MLYSDKLSQSLTYSMESESTCPETPTLFPKKYATPKTLIHILGIKRTGVSSSTNIQSSHTETSSQNQQLKQEDHITE